MWEQMNIGLQKTTLGVVTLFIVLFAFAQISLADTAIRWDTSQKGLAYNLVREKLKPEIADLEKQLGRKLYIDIGRADLNGDGTPELIAYIPDTPAVCSENVPCPFYIYAYTKRGLVEIGRIKSYNIIVASTNTAGILDIKSFENNKVRETTYYKWDGKQYKKSS